MSNQPQMPWLSNDELLDLFEAAGVEMLIRAKHHESLETPYPMLQRVRATAEAVAGTADVALGEMGQPTFGYLDRAKALKKISEAGERLIKNSINPTFAGAFKIATEGILDAFKK